MSDRFRGAHARDSEGVRRRAHQIGTELITIFVLFQQNRLHLTKVPHEIRPGNFDLPLIQTLLQVYLQAESQETGDDMADRRIIPMMIDRPEFQGGFLLPEGSLYPPQAFLGLGHLDRRQVGIGSEDELAVQSGIPRHGVFISGGAPLGHLEKAGRAPVADDGLGALFFDGAPEFVHDSLPDGGVFFSFQGIAADDVTIFTYPNLLDFQVVGHRLITAAPGQDFFTYFLPPSHPAAQHVSKGGWLIFQPPKTWTGCRYLAVSAAEPEIPTASTTLRLSLNLPRERSKPSNSPEAAS